MRGAALAAALLAPRAAGYTLDGSAPYWERVLSDPGCDHKTDCGFVGITAEQCHERGCCYDPHGLKNWCSGTPARCGSGGVQCAHGTCVNGSCQCAAGWQGWLCNDTQITTVHLVQSCHLDAGFTDLASGVLNRYFTHHIPLAIKTGKELRADPLMPPGYRLRFMAQSWYVSLYLDCPPGAGLQCPSAEELAEFKEAVRVGDITWHAFPHNAELENTSPAMIEEGLRMTRELDDALGQPRKRFLSQRDVPGVPRSVIPILVRNNVSLITVGVNGASMYPRVPKIFRWKDTVSGDSVVTMWHPRGYGGYSVGEAVTVPGFPHALVTDWIGDNQGPGDASHYRSLLTQIRREFPGAQVVASTFDNFTDQLRASGLADSLPVVEEEVGDSWIFGVPSDPKKTAQARALDRAVVGYLAAGGQRDAPFKNFTRFAVKNCEHTWGRDVKSNLKDDASWRNSDFEFARTQGKDRAQYDALEASWWEQRAWGFDYTLQTLPEGHDLKRRAKQEIDDINQAVPDPAAEGYTKVADPGTIFQCGGVALGFDPASGAVTTLVDKVANVSWAAPTAPLLGLSYRTYSQTDFEIFQDNYANLTSPPDWFRKDFGKPNDTFSQHSLWHGKLDELWSLGGDGQTSFIVRSRIVDDKGDSSYAHAEYGAPDHFITRVVVPHSPAAGAPRLTVTIWCVNKTSTRNPESMFIGFRPSGAGSWEMQKLGQWQRTDDVVAGGSQHLHGVSIGSGFRFNKTAAGAVHSLGFEAVDAPIINLGAPLGFPVPCVNMSDPWAYKPDVATYGVSSVLWNNLWGTNYVQWYPFNSGYEPVPGEENFISRYYLRF